MSLLPNAKALLLEGGYTCVLTNGTETYSSTSRGVKPLVQFLLQGDLPSGLYAADKVVGRATAFLYVLLDVAAVYADVISIPAREVLLAHGIAVEHTVLVPHIVNRTRDGICPFEEAVLPIDTPTDAYLAIRKKMDELGISI